MVNNEQDRSFFLELEGIEQRLSIGSSRQSTEQLKMLFNELKNAPDNPEKIGCAFLRGSPPSNPERAES